MHKMHVQAQLCLTLSDTMDRSMPGFPVCHQPGACSNSFPSRWWCHPTISSSYPLLLPPSTIPSIRFFSSELFFTSGGQSIGASASVLPMNIQDWSPLGWTGWIFLQSKGLSRVFSNTTVEKHQFWTLVLFPILQDGRWKGWEARY